MRFLSLALALSGGAAAALTRRADNNTNAAPVAKSFIVEYAPVSYHAEAAILYTRDTPS